MVATITIIGADAQLSGDFPLSPVIEATSYLQQGYQFTPRYKMGTWDGRVRLFRRLNSTFPAGLTHDVAAALKDEGVQVVIDDQRRRPPLSPIPKDIKLFGVSFEYPYDYQLDCMEKMVLAQRGVVAIATNGGKCLAPATPILLFSGKTKTAEQVQVGDLLMGPDSKPRRVLSTCTGTDDMFLVDPKRCGESFTCNSAHVLTIFDPTTETVVDVSLQEFLGWNKDRCRLSRLVRTGVTFPAHEDQLAVDPWLLGLWYADGRKDLNFVEISKPDSAVELALLSIATEAGLTLNCYRYKDKCPAWRLVTDKGKPNNLLRSLRSIYGSGKRLPFRYLTGSVEERSSFLAGLIDGDGSSDGMNIEWMSNNQAWAKDFAFLARSLGFGASIRSKKVMLPTWDSPRTYWRVVLSGSTASLPLRLIRKHSYPKKQSKLVGFRIEPVGRGPYCGFTLSGDGRFLLGDFTITHNTEIACLVAACLRVPTLFLVPGKELLYQTQRRFAKRFGLTDNEIGIIGDGIWKPNQWVTVAIVASIYEALKAGKEKAVNLLDNIELIFADECHKVGSDSWYEILRICNAFFRYGLSGTPLRRSDGADLKLIAATGPIIYEVRNKMLIERGISSEAEIRLMPIRQPEIPRKTPYRDVYKVGITENLYRNRALCGVVDQLVKEGRRVVVMVKEIDHGNQIDKRLWSFKGQAFITHKFINGQESSYVRQQALREFEKGDLQVLIATSILDEGVDLPCIDAIVLAGGGKCLGPDVPVMKYNGTIVPASSICKGDILMGPDSKPRQVRETTTGVGPMFKIIPKDKGMCWTCNDAHLLTVGFEYDLNRVEDRIVTDCSKKYLRQLSLSIDFDKKEPVPVDPYFLGVWFGDGSKTIYENGNLVQVAITKPDLEIKEIVHKVANEFGLFVYEMNSLDCPTYRISHGRLGQVPNKFLDLMRSIVGDASGLPINYLTASRGERTQFLAGLLDTDGYHHNGCYEITQKRQRYADGICFLAHSLGFRTYKRAKSINGEIYWRVTIKGDCHTLPLRITRKKAIRTNRVHGRTPFTVESIGLGSYTGFMVDGDGRFLLGDCTVTHNSSIKTLQRIGRGLRKGSTGKLVVVDTIDFQHRYLLEHSNQRVTDYRDEDCFTIVEHKIDAQTALPL